MFWTVWGLCWWTQDCLRFLDVSPVGMSSSTVLDELFRGTIFNMFWPSHLLYKSLLSPKMKQYQGWTFCLQGGWQDTYMFAQNGCCGGCEFHSPHPTQHWKYRGFVHVNLQNNVQQAFLSCNPLQKLQRKQFLGSLGEGGGSSQESLRIVFVFKGFVFTNSGPLLLP